MNADFSDELRWHLDSFIRPVEEAWSVKVGVFREGESPGDDVPWSYLTGRAVTFRGRSIAGVLSHAVWDIHHVVPEKTRDFVLLHAAVAAFGGRALIVPALSGVGKSSLALALAHTGASYLSDEIGAIDPVTSRVWPFPRRITLDKAALEAFPSIVGRLEPRPPLTRLLGEEFVHPREIGSEIGGPADPGWIVFPSRDREGPPRLRALDRAETVRRMAEHCFNLFRYGDRGVIVLSRVAEAAPGYELVGGVAAERADLLLQDLT